ncbi:hypothetical protein QE152_g14084 [Popillia japonica]|uniref:Uncharacterized protein n=1 Tax=Popillia japonica TaxID=7064 RepID=A0AAW1L9R2_POPJA
MEKAMHSQFYKSMEEQNLSRELTFAFLNTPGLYSETESYIMACQNGVYGSLVYRKIVMIQPLQDTRCRALLYYYLRHIHGIDEEKNPAYPYPPGDIPAVVQNENVKIFWNFPFSPTAEITAYKPDMVVLHRQTENVFVIEMSCPSERNIQSKKLKNTFILFRLKHTYPGYKSIIFIPLIIGVCGVMKPTVTDGVRKLNFDTATTRSIVHQMQKYVVLGLSYVVIRWNA